MPYTSSNLSQIHDFDPVPSFTTFDIMVPEQEVIPRALDRLRSRYGPDLALPVVAAFAPGRVNLIGEHTDYNEGFVFPMCLEYGTFVIGARVPGTTCKVYSAAMEAEVSFEMSEIKTIASADKGSWQSYVVGTMAKYLEEVAADKVCHGFHAVIDGNLPVGGGVSSSASVEVSMMTFLEEMYNTPLDSQKKALLCQAAEHEYADMPCGIMDQLITATGKKGKALLIDCRSLNTTPVQVSQGQTKIVVTNSMVKHLLHDSEYPQRVQQCKESLDAIAKHFGTTKRSLREVTMQEVQEAYDAKHMSELAFKRARHVVTENERTEKAVEAFRTCDYQSAGRLMSESHKSLKEDYQVSCEEVDKLVEIAAAQEGVWGSRMTGAGFGGCIVTLVESDKVEAVEAAISEQYLAATGKQCTHIITEPGYFIPEQHVMECLIRTKQLKEQGNALFKSGQIKQALEKYHRMHFHVAGLKKDAGGGGGGIVSMMQQGNQNGDGGPDDDQKKEIDGLIGQMHMNKSMCYVKLQFWEKGIDACTKALDSGADEAKCLYRRGTCYLQSGMLDKADDDLQKAATLMPGDANIQRELKLLAVKQKASEDKAKKTFQKMFG